jgi:hypothetical protein
MADRLIAETEEDETLTLVRLQFEEYLEGTKTAREAARKCRRYKDGNQWTTQERDTLNKRKQPCITDNKIQDKCDTLFGIEKQMRTDPKAFPRNPGDDGSAEAATDALRYIADASSYKQSCRKPAVDNLMVEGICAGQVIIEKRKGQPPKVCIEHIRRDRSYYDIHSLREDFSDKTYCGYTTWMDYEQAKGEFKGKEEALDSSFTFESVAGSDEDQDDKPRYTQTVRQRKRIQVFNHYFLKGKKWHEAIWCRGGWLEKPKPAAYKDEYGESTCCIEMQALYRAGEDGAPYGVVQRYLDLQDEHNKRRSKMLHLLNAKRIFARKGEIEDLAKVRTELHKPDGVVEVSGDIQQVRVEDNLAEAEGQWRLLQQTDNALATVGPNSAIEGTSGALSGVAKARDQQAGQLSISPLFEALDAWEVRIYRQAWARVRQYWTAPMWIRVTDDPEKIKFVGLNQPVTAGEQFAEELKKDPRSPEEKQAIIQEIAQDPAAQLPAVDPKTGKPMKKNEVGAIDVDIIIDRGQDVVTVQQEEFGLLAEIAKGRPEIPFDVLVEMSQLRATTKKKVLDRMKGADDPAAQQMAQMQQAMQELSVQLQAAQVRRENAAAAKDEQATVESQVDASVKIATFTEGSDQAGPAEKSSVSVN